MTFVELLEKFGIEYRTTGHHHCSPGWVSIDCPQCSPGWGHFRLGYNNWGGYMNCWACGPKRTINVLSEILDLPLRMIQTLMKELTKEVDQEEDIEVRGKLELPRSLVPLDRQHKRYLEKRGFIPADLVNLWGIKGLGLARMLSWRIFIPITYKGETVSWTTRSISDKHKMRYRSAEASQEKVNHKDLIYGEDYCRHAIIVVEGPTDVWKVGPGAGCTFGTGFTKKQVERIARYPIRAVCYDNEQEGQKRARELCELLAPFDGETMNIILASKDPGCASASEIQQLRKLILS